MIKWLRSQTNGDGKGTEHARMTIRLTRELVSGTTDKGSIAIATPDAVTRRRARALAFLLEAAGANVDLGEFAEAELAQPLPPEAASPKVI